MALNNWLSLIEGVVATGAGVLFICFRSAIAAFYAQFYRSINSALGEREVRASKPRTMLRVGVVFLLIGIGSLLMAIFRHQW